MRILYLSQYFPPEVGATQTRGYEMARNLVRLGHEVTVLTELPNHPAGITFPDYRERRIVRRDLEGIDVIHSWVWATPTKTMRTRLAFYLSYMLSAIVSGLLVARGRYDVIYCTSPPLFVGGAGLALSYLRRTPLVFEVRDLWPESAVALGELRSKPAVRLAAGLARWCYRRSRRIVAVTEGVRQGIVATGVAREKVALIPNGANSELFHHDAAAAAACRRELETSQEDFVLVYAGIFGLAYALESVLQAAELLRDESHFQFWLIGAGPREEALRRQWEAASLPNVRFLGEKSYVSLPGYLAAADVALIPLRRLALFDGTLPVKMFDAWACETPTILAVAGGESQRATEEAGGGVIVPPEDAAALAEQILALFERRSELAGMGAAGRRYVEQHYSRAAQAAQLADLLQDVIRDQR